MPLIWARSCCGVSAVGDIWRGKLASKMAVSCNVAAGVGMRVGTPRRILLRLLATGAFSVELHFTVTYFHMPFFI